MVSAHESNKSFFKIEQKDATIEVIAEFPWTIRNALLEFAPELKTSKSKDEFDEKFFNYIKSAFIISDIKGKQLELLSVVHINTEGHSHQNNYLIVFKGSTYNKVKNTISFNLKNKQVNYHTLKKGYETNIFNTTINSPSFMIMNQHNAAFGYLWLLILIPILLGFACNRNLIANKFN